MGAQRIPAQIADDGSYRVVMDVDVSAVPFLKYPGGKRGLMWRIATILPRTMATYFEPMIGAGACFFQMANEGRFKRAVLSDNNEELVRTWLAIKRNVVGVCRELDAHKHNRRHYEKVRALDPAKMSDEKTAARMLFMNAAGFNGLVRYNRAGQFNTPWGRQAKMLQFKDPQRLRDCARVLNEHKVTIVAADFADVTRKARLGDVVFYDSPYVPISKTSSFVGYSRHGFGADDHARLAVEFKRLDKAGIEVLLCNSNCDTVRRLYAGFRFESIAAKRAINSDTTKRGEIKELLISSRALDVGK